MITIPEGFIADALAYVGQLFTDLAPLILLVFALPLAFWVIRQVISLVVETTERPEEEPEEDEDEEEPEEDEDEELSDGKIRSFFNRLHEERGRNRGRS